MRWLQIALSISMAILVLTSGMVVAEPVSTFQTSSPPPSPPFVLQDPVINEISYKVVIENSGDTSAFFKADVALPRNWSPDTYVEIVGAQATAGESRTFDMRGNHYIEVNHTLSPQESIIINVTFLSLKYDLSVYTHNPVRSFGYPADVAIYTQPETYIESNDSGILSVASAIVGSSINPFRIAEKVYSFTISHLRYVSQQEIRGALSALANGEGDCTEYSTLFVAMMRGVGIPARTVTGHMSSVLSLGGSASAGPYWTDSPHMWAEFYVDGFGWIPVDASSGESDPMNHFGLSDSRYLPILKGQPMETPYRSLFTIQSEQMSSLDVNETLVVRPQAQLPTQDHAIVNIYSANLQVTSMKAAAESAYDYDFNVTSGYSFMQEAYDALRNASDYADSEDTANTEYFAAIAEERATQALDTISSIVIDDARSAVSRAWVDSRLLGALGGERYLEEAADCESRGDYLGMVKYAHYAEVSAEESVSVLLFAGMLVFSGFVVWIVGKDYSASRKHRQSQDGP